MRPIMTRAELAQHHVRDYGRDYSESDDGYSDMAAEEARGWRVIPGWGRDGWDLGEWPYVAFYVRDRDSRFELMTIVEGDRSVWSFADRDDRIAAIDYLFLWYAAGQSWAPLAGEDRAALDAGTLRVDDKYRGPYSTRPLPASFPVAGPTAETGVA